MSEYTDAVERGLYGLTAVSTGTCPGCAECMEHSGHSDEQEHRLAWQNGEVDDEGHFSWSPCGICGSRLGGHRECWHGIILKPSGGNTPIRELHHFDDACVDCVCYLANGTEPEDWK